MLTRRRVLAFLLATALAGASPPGAAAAEPVRHTTTETSQGGTVVIVADIAAPLPAVLDVIFDVEGRVADVRDLKRGELYLTGSDVFAAEYDLAILGMEHQFHIRYEADRGAGVVTFALDPALRNDIDTMNGSYVLQATPMGTRLTYTCQIEAGYFVPRFLRRRLVTDRAVQEIEGIRTRAEAL
jgi:hypothetical protein